jgi:hypothetical protein
VDLADLRLEQALAPLRNIAVQQKAQVDARGFWKDQRSQAPGLSL